MFRAGFFFLALLTLLHSANALAKPALRLAPRAFLSNLPKSGHLSSITQVKNPKWMPQKVSTSVVYAAPFLKNHIPMPANLSAALYTSQYRRDVDKTILLGTRATGQVVDGRDGE